MAVGDISGFKSYAEWQAANRAAGGPGESAEVRAAFANGGQAPAVQPTNVYSAQGPQEITDTNRQTADMTADQRAAWAAQNLNSFDAQSRQAGGGPGATTQQAFDQWKAWDDKYDPSCPPNMPYRGRGGQCDESPDNCPPGTTMHGSSCVPWDQVPAWAGGGGQGGGGGAQGGGGGAAPGASSPSTPTDPLQAQLVNMYGERGNMFGAQQDGGFGQDLAGGGIFWGAGGQTAVNPALAQATLTAFTPNAPSQQAPQRDAPGGTYSDPYEAKKQGGTYVPPANSGFAGGLDNKAATAGQPNIASTVNAVAGAMPAGQGALEQTLQTKYANPNKWWMAKQEGPQVA